VASRICRAGAAVEAVSTFLSTCVLLAATARVQRCAVMRGRILESARKMFTYLARTGPYYFGNRYDVLLVKCLVKDYGASKTVNEFNGRAIPRLKALADERGEPYNCLLVHRVFRDLSLNLAVSLGKQEGVVSRMLD